MKANSSSRKRSRAEVEEVDESPPTISSTILTTDAEAPPPAKKPRQKASLFVRSLPATASTESLIAHFSASYPIKHATAVTDPATKQCKGYGFVTFADAEDAQRALKEFDGSKLGGKKIKLEIAEPRKRDVEDAIPGAIAAGEGKPRSQPSAATVAAKAERVKKKQEDARPPKLIIRNLPWSIKKPEQLAELFRKYGKVKIATIPSKKPGLLAGFGFVVLRGKPNAEKAIAGMNGMELDGRTLAVDWAVEKGEWEKQNKPAEAEDKDDVAEDETGAASEEDDEDTKDAEDMDDEDDMSDDEIASDDDGEENLNMTGDTMEEMDDIEEEEEDTQEVTTLFIRNLPFDCDDDMLKEHFTHFGPIRYARIVLDPATERPRGTAFVSFFNVADAKACLRHAPRPSSIAPTTRTTTTPSILQNADVDDPEGHYTLLGRLLALTPAVSRDNAAKITTDNIAKRDVRDKDRRRLYLLSEGTISAKSPLYDLLSQKEIDMRSASAKQRQQIIRSNGSLHLSLTRLSVRNIPRSVTSKDLKALAREAVVEFAKDVKEGKREKLSKEELARGADEMAAAERERKKKGVGIVKQAKVVFEGKEGSKVGEDSGAGRSRGYGFIEYYTHRAALMGLRWMNGHAVGYKVDAAASKRGKRKEVLREEMEDRKKRLIVEFAIENAQVVHRRSEREVKSKDRNGEKSGNANATKLGETNERGFKGGAAPPKEKTEREKRLERGKHKGNTNKGNVKKGQPVAKEPMNKMEAKAAAPVDQGMMRRNRIIGKKRAIRKKGGA